MAAPKKPVVEMQPQEQQPDEIAKLRQEVKRLQNYLIHMSVQLSSFVPPAPVAREKGNSMQPFLVLMERRFRKMAPPQELWGDELGKYLDEDALQCWMDLKQSGMDMTDWPLIKQELIRCVCPIDRATLIYPMADNKWKGDHNTYTANFSRIAARGSQLSAEELAGCFLKNIPSELRWAVTQREMVCYQCKGKGHMAKNCLTGDPSSRKSGEASRNCGVATEPNAIAVSPQWAEKLIHKEQGAPADEQGPTACRTLSAERKTAAQAPAGNGEVTRNTDNSREVNVGVPIEDRQSVTNVELPPWWRELVASDGSKKEGMLCSASTPAVLPVGVVGRSLGPVPYDIVLGLDWLTKHKLSWYFHSDNLKTYLDGRWCELPLVRVHMDKRTEDDNPVASKRTPAEQPIPEEQQGALCCTIISHDNTQAQEVPPTPVVDIAHATDDEASPWHTAELEFTLFHEWMQLSESQDLPQEIREVLQTHIHVFPDSLPPGLPPKRPHDHYTLLAPGKFPTKSALYRMTPDQLRFHKQEIAKLSAHGWISPTYSPIWAPTIMVDKRDDGTGERQMRMGFNYQALNALGLPTHAALLQKVLSVFLTNRFYPKFRKCQFARQELTYLGYAISAEGIKPAAGKIEAIRMWPEVLENETQVRQFLGTVNYCRMFMGPDYADISRPLVTLTCKDTPFHWIDAHTHAVRQLKQRLIDYTTLQVPDTSKPFELYNDTSGYAIGGVLEQAGQPVGFVSQAMPTVQQKYSIYDQELLALFAALDKRSHLLRVAKVTAFTDHQALTHLRQLQTSKPFRGRTARWLDFLAEFPDLTIAYLEGARNTVADALSRLPCHSSSQSSPVPSPSPPLFSESSAPLLLAPAHPYPAHHPRRTQDNESLPDDNEPSDILPVQPADSEILDWPAAYAKCPIFRASYTTAVQTVGHREQKKTLLSLSKLYYWPGMRTYTNAYVESCTQCQLGYNTTSHVSTELSPFEVTIGENPLTAADLDVVGALSPTLTPPMTKLFYQLCDRPQSHILKAKCQQKQYADTHRREVEHALVPDRPRAPEQEPQEAVVGWPPTRDVAGKPKDPYEVGYIMEQRGSGDEAHYLVKWRASPEDRATWEPASHFGGCRALLRAWQRLQRNRRPP
ncbi:OSJNBa0042D13.18 protein, related [Eimeria praecox]|uniref:OSJNBa0042D13.18 protein, related n=1 Tax=Eimeria praecox TaxID=51316 RepID=U6GRM8_9EIME|nr:OSJNBa0042D13.18 protein, related [Eimeria praecox]